MQLIAFFIYNFMVGLEESCKVRFLLESEIALRRAFSNYST